MKSLNMTQGAAVAVTVLGIGILGPSGEAYALEEAAQLKLGEIEYMGNCASCHGANGKGDGPVAEVLSTKPSDLTQISKSFSGTFPDDHIYQVIDGQKMINPHGDRLMPVWGPRYFEVATETADRVPHDVNAQALAHGRIVALVKYLKSIQAD